MEVKMHISSSSVSLASSQISIQNSSKYERLRKWDSNSNLFYESMELNGKKEKTSEIVKNNIPKPSQFSAPSPLKNVKVESIVSQKQDLIKKNMREFVAGIKVKIMKDIIESMTGKKIDTLDTSRITDPESKDQPSEADSSESKKNVSSQPDSPAQKNPSIPDWGLDYYYKETNYTKEGVTFNASGKVTTGDGKEIQFDTTLEMSREKYDEISVSVKAGAARLDPLMIDLTGKGAGFSKEKFEFDLDGNGTMELINAPSSGTGFLAFDKNGNGIIDDGSELFGPSSGNGFDELSAYDEDGNGWIDENDSIYSKLKLWLKDPQGNDVFSSLSDSAIGAIYTKRASTQYNIVAANDPKNSDVSAVLKETGLYLRENGAAGFVQEVDLVA
jgi:hypothetical protein